MALLLFAAWFVTRTAPPAKLAAPTAPVAAQPTPERPAQLSLPITQPKEAEEVAENENILSVPPLPSTEGHWTGDLARLAERHGLAPATAPPTSRPIRNPAFASLASLTPSRPSEVPDASVTDEQIEQAIRKGLDYLLRQFGPRHLKQPEQYGADVFPGTDALCVYALLQAGQAVGDERLKVNTALVKGLLNGLKELEIARGPMTYSRSLRISALAVHNRREDRATMDQDAKWLMESTMQGAFTYSKPSQGTTRASGGWDNSNSQYGGLGLWAAAEAGSRVPTAFWRDVERHWTDCQVPDPGGWDYRGGGGPPTLTMTCAGATMLMVARDRMAAEGSAWANVQAPLSKPLVRALEWLDEGDNAVRIGAHPGYTLYGLERIGLASGYKYFGKHDWYRELAKKAVAEQQADGSWVGGDGTAVETAFHVLFLARGREPVFMAKLRYDGGWANKPRDVAALTAFAGRALERELNWQTVGTQRDWTDWTDAPVLLLSGDEAPALSEQDVGKLVSYVRAGGLLMTHADRGSAGFNRFAEELARRVFPGYAMAELPEDHPVYSLVFPVETKPKLMGLGNGSRLLWIHSPTDLTRLWTGRADKAKAYASELGVNVVMYATGKRDLRRRLQSTYVAERSGPGTGTIPLARLRYDGNWDPEPWGWVRMARRFDHETDIRLDVRTVDLASLSPETAPVAHLTGTAAREFTETEVRAVGEYVRGGGVLLVDSCGGSAAFAESVRVGLVERALPGVVPEPVGNGLRQGDNRDRLRTRGGAGDAQGLRVFAAGRGAVILTDLDISSGLLGTMTWGIRGYEPATAERLVRDAILWAVWPEGDPRGTQMAP